MLRKRAGWLLLLALWVGAVGGQERDTLPAPPPPKVLRPASEWPQFRGPNGSGVAETSGLPTRFGPDENVVWKTAVPPGRSSPVLSGGRVFLTAVEDDKLYALCFSRTTGRELWRRECPRPRTEKLDRRNHPAAASAGTDHNSVYVFFGDFGLLSYDFEGNERWRLPLGPFDNSYGMGASPIVVDDLVVLVCDQRTDSFILAVDKKTGRVRWRRPRPDAVSGHSTPVVYGAGDGIKQILAPGSFRLDAYAVETGESVWWVNGLPSEMKSLPVISRGIGSDIGSQMGGRTVYVAGYNVPANDAGRQVTVPAFAEAVASYDANGDGRLARDELPAGRLHQLVGFSDRDRDGRLDAGEWRLYAAAQASENGLRAIRLEPEGRPRGDRTAATLRWTYPRAVPQLPSPLLYERVLYMINDGGILTALDPETGGVVKRMRLRGGVDHYYASPVAADGKVFFVSQGGAVTVLRAGAKPKVLAVNELNEECHATPAIADGRLYVRTASALYCFGEKPSQERK